MQIDRSGFAKARKGGVEISIGRPSPDLMATSTTEDAYRGSGAKSRLSVSGGGGGGQYCYSSGRDDEYESPSMADLSSNNTPPNLTTTTASPSKRHRPKKKSRQAGKRRTSRDEIDQSVFPVRTPDKEGFLGPLADLLEEEITLPGESREQSVTAADKKKKDWAYLPAAPKSPSTSTTSSITSSEASLGESTVRQAVDSGKLTPTDPADAISPGKQRAISAKSHIFRKGKIEAAK